MKKKHIDIFMFIDALGWEIVQKHNFLADILPHQYKVEMQFGYSATAIPTILTGKPPTEHKHLSFYYYAPEKSPFKIMKYLMLHILPSRIFDRWRVRRILSKIIAKLYGFTGYFELYAMPYDRLPYFDYIEKSDMFIPGGLSPVINLADMLESCDISWHISNWRKSETENIQELHNELKKGEISFAFLYTAALDGLLHRVTKDGEGISEKLSWYSEKVEELIATASEHYETYSFHVISDHGMTTTVGTIDLKKEIQLLPLKFGKDYVAVYDSTMARFWFFTDTAKEKVRNCLNKVKEGHILRDEELTKYQINFSDNMYGEIIFLMDPGWQIEPCDMGLKALPAMHGFAPEHPDSYASFLSTDKQTTPPKWVGDYFTIMEEYASKTREQ